MTSKKLSNSTKIQRLSNVGVQRLFTVYSLSCACWEDFNIVLYFAFVKDMGKNARMVLHAFENASGNVRLTLLPEIVQTGMRA